MKIAVTATGPGLDAQVDPRFGRCQSFVIVDSETREVLESFANPSVSLGGGAGVQTAAFIADRGVGVVLTGNCGPNAFRTLAAAGVKVFTGASGTVEDTLGRFEAGELVPASDATVPPHFGMSQGGGGGRGD